MRLRCRSEVAQTASDRVPSVQSRRGDSLKGRRRSCGGWAARSDRRISMKRRLCVDTHADHPRRLRSSSSRTPPGLGPRRREHREGEGERVALRTDPPSRGSRTRPRTGPRQPPLIRSRTAMLVSRVCARVRNTEWEAVRARVVGCGTRGEARFAGLSHAGWLDAQAGPGTVSARAEPGRVASAVAGAAMSRAIRPRLAARIAPMIAVTAPKPGACGTW